MNRIEQWKRALWAGVGVLALAGCASSPPGEVADAAPDVVASPWGETTGGAWRHQSFPGKQATDFRYDRKDGRHAVAVKADASASMLRQDIRMLPEMLGQLHFSWQVPALIEGADVAARELDDSPVRIVLAFDGDRSRLSPRDAMLSELSRALTGEEMPYATLMYVWCNHRKPGEVIVNSRTSRIRKLVVESGSANLGRWIEYERDVRADYERVFGEPPGALIGVALMTDSDNTRSQTRAWYGPVRLAQPAWVRR